VNNRAKRFSGRRSIVSIAGILSAAVLGFLPGCGDSATAAADKRVQDAADKAARVGGSAGAYRPTEAMMEKVRAAGWQDAQQKTLIASITASLSATKEITALNAKLAELMKQNTPDQDLAAQIKELTAAMAGDPASAGVQSLAQTQLANLNSMAASAQIDQASTAIADLVQKAVNIQLQASDIAYLGTEAGVGDAVVAAYKGTLGAPGDGGQGVYGDLAAAKVASESAAAKLKEQSAKVADLQAQVDQKRKESQDARQKAQELQIKVDQAKGDDVLKLFDQVAELRNVSAAAMAAMTLLRPDLESATSDQQSAAVEAQTTKANYDLLQSVVADMESTVAGSGKDSNTWKAKAQALLDDKKTGFNQAVAAFKADAEAAKANLTKINSESRATIDFCEKAKNSLQEYNNKIAQTHHEAADPLTKISASKQLAHLLDLTEASASNRSGQAHLLGSSLAALSDEVATTSAQVTHGPMPGTNEAVANERKAAAVDFQTASSKASTVKAAPDNKGTPLAWLSLMVYAIAEEGTEVATPGKSQPGVQSHHDSALRAAADAEALNSLLVIEAVDPEK